MRFLLRCPVRGCAEPLVRDGNRWSCAQGHSFDRNRSGALNLLQPQDRRSKSPGDSKEAARARHRLAQLNHAKAVHDAFAHVLRARASEGPRSILDVGCGEGAFLRSLQTIDNLELHGVDISAPSIEIAAKTQPKGLFIVANADRDLPYIDRAFDFIASIDSRINPAEFARLLKPGGLVLIAVPADDDLVELRERVYGARVDKPRAERVERDLEGSFKLAERTTVRESRDFDAGALRDLLTTTYRGFRAKERAAVDALGAMTVTLSHDVLAFEPR